MNKIDSTQVDANIKQLTSTLPSKLEKTLSKACMLVVRDAKEKVPVDTGTLRNSIQYKTQTGADKAEGVIYTNIEYAPYVEIGTGRKSSLGNGANMAGSNPHPYLKPALDNNKQKIINLFRGLL